MFNNRYYLFPFNLIPAGSRVIIYGIGEIGRAYVEQIKATGYCYIALLVDKNYEEINRYYQYKVHSKYDINSQSYDFLIIASDQYQKAICDDLISIGVDKNKIVTHDAIILGRGLDIIAAAVTKSNYTGEVCHLHLKELWDYRFYTEDTETYQKKCSRNYFIEETCNVRIVENGIIWSSEWDTIDSGIENFGGIFTADGRYADGIRKHSDISYEDTRKALYSDETVVYGGHLMNHYGHTITECISRMWWHLENSGGRYKYAFTIEKSRRYNFLEFFLLFGLREEDIILVEEPTRFKSVIVPECAFNKNELWFKDKAVNIYNYLRDRVKPAGYGKVYLTRTALRNTDFSLTGEEYFEDYYRSMGYEVISPEQLSIPEQIAIMAGAKKIACTGGTLQHQILFCQTGYKELSRVN